MYSVLSHTSWAGLWRKRVGDGPAAAYGLV